MIDNLRSKKRLFRYAKALLLAIVIPGAFLNGCSGGGDDNDEGIIGTGYLLQGTVSSERRLVKNEVEVKASTGEKTIASIDSDGRFRSGDIEGDGPYLMRVDVGNGQYQYSIGHLDGNAIAQNIHSYTDATARNWFALQGVNVDSEFADEDGLEQMPTGDQYGSIFNSLADIVSLVRQDYGIEAVDLASIPFDADDTGVDLYLNQNPVIINNNQISIIIRDPNNSTQSVAASSLDIATNLTAADGSPPSTPDAVRVLPAGNDELVIVWEPSVDNIGVSGYQIWRDGVQIDTTPFPVYTDSGLAGNTEYSYAVVAIDSVGNESSTSILQVGSTSSEIDTVPPPAPVSLAASANTRSVQLTWQQSSINDVARFEVSRGTGNEALEPFLNVTSTFLTDVTVESGIQYCYVVVAIDSAGNRSADSQRQCATTAGQIIVTQLPDNVRVSFVSSNYTVTENSSSIEVAISRGGVGATSVDYTTVDGSATSGQDYTATGGTFVWAEGDSSTRKFSVQIASDNVDEGDESFQIMLTNAGGNAIIGNSETTVTIRDSASSDCNGSLTTTNIENDLAVDAGCYEVSSSIDVRNGANLTLAPGTTLKFSAGTALRVQQGGSFTANGTVAQPILLTGAERVPGFWNGLSFNFSNSQRNSLRYVTVEYGGGGNDDSNVRVKSLNTSNSRVSISNSTMRHSVSYGLAISGGSVIGEFSNNTLTSNDSPVLAEPDMVGVLKSDSAFTGNRTDVVEVSSGTVDQAAVWSKLDVPYLLQDLNLNDTLTLSRGITMRFRSNSQLRVSSEGALIAVGTQSDPIVFTGEEQTPGFWDGIALKYSSSPLNRLEHVVIEYGGTQANEGANLSVESFLSTSSRIALSDVVFRHSMDYGFNIAANSVVTAFENVTSVSNNRSGVMAHSAIGNFGSGNSLAGNQIDGLIVVSQTEDQPSSWPMLDVPYFSDGMSLNANLTLAPGVRLVMGVGAEIRVERQGSLTARGTTAAPIVFTSMQPVAGYWDGIKFVYSSSNNNILDNVLLEYAGGGGAITDSANIELQCLNTAPVILSLSNTAISNSAGWGVLTEDRCQLNLGTGMTYFGNAAGAVGQR